MKRKKILPLLAGVLLAVSLFPAAAAMENGGPVAAGENTAVSSGNIKETTGAAERENTENTENTEDTADAGNTADTILYNERTGHTYLISGLKGTLRCITADQPQSGAEAESEPELKSESGYEIDVELLSQRKDENFVYGDISASALSEDGTMLAVALCHMDAGEQGRAVIFQCRDDGSLEYLSMVATGISPEMIVFDDRESLLLTADRGGDPAADRVSADSEDSGEKEDGAVRDLSGRGGGSVTAVDITAVRQASLSQDALPGFSSGAAVITDFSAFDDPEIRSRLLQARIIGEKDEKPSEKFRPECITVSGGQAYVTLKGIDAMALFDLGEKRFTGILPMDPEL